MYSFNHRNKPLSLFVLSLVTVNLLGLFVYRERVFTYHFAPMMPYIFIFSGVLLSKLGHKFTKTTPFVILTLFVLINTKSLLTSKSEVSFATKKRVVNEIIRRTQGEAISIDVLPSCEVYGFRYLFTSGGKPVAKSWVDYALGYLYKEELIEDFDTKVTIAIPDAGSSPNYDTLFTQSSEIADEITTIGKITIFFSSPPHTDSSTKVD